MQKVNILGTEYEIIREAYEDVYGKITNTCHIKE